MKKDGAWNPDGILMVMVILAILLLIIGVGVWLLCILWLFKVNFNTYWYYWAIGLAIWVVFCLLLIILGCILSGGKAKKKEANLAMVLAQCEKDLLTGSPVSLRAGQKGAWISVILDPASNFFF